MPSARLASIAALASIVLAGCIAGPPGMAPSPMGSADEGPGDTLIRPLVRKTPAACPPLDETAKAANVAAYVTGDAVKAAQAMAEALGDSLPEATTAGGTTALGNTVFIHDNSGINTLDRINYDLSSPGSIEAGTLADRRDAAERIAGRLGFSVADLEWDMGDGLWPLAPSAAAGAVGLPRPNGLPPEPFVTWRFEDSRQGWAIRKAHEVQDPARLRGLPDIEAAAGAFFLCWMSRKDVPDDGTLEMEAFATDTTDERVAVFVAAQVRIPGADCRALMRIDAEDGTVVRFWDVSDHPLCPLLDDAWEAGAFAIPPSACWAAPVSRSVNAVPDAAFSGSDGDVASLLAAAVDASIVGPAVGDRLFGDPAWDTTKGPIRQTSTGWQMVTSADAPHEAAESGTLPEYGRRVAMALGHTGALEVRETGWVSRDGTMMATSVAGWSQGVGTSVRLLEISVNGGKDGSGRSATLNVFRTYQTQGAVLAEDALRERAGSFLECWTTGMLPGSYTFTGGPRPGDMHVVDGRWHSVWWSTAATAGRTCSLTMIIDSADGTISRAWAWCP
jgi:hypothetical protein